MIVFSNQLTNHLLKKLLNLCNLYRKNTSKLDYFFDYFLKNFYLLYSANKAVTPNIHNGF